VRDVFQIDHAISLFLILLFFKNLLFIRVIKLPLEFLLQIWVLLLASNIALNLLFLIILLLLLLFLFLIVLLNLALVKTTYFLYLFGLLNLFLQIYCIAFDNAIIFRFLATFIDKCVGWLRTKFDAFVILVINLNIWIILYWGQKSHWGFL